MCSIMKNINHSLEQNLIVIVILNQMQWRIESMHVKQEIVRFKPATTLSLTHGLPKQKLFEREHQLGIQWRGALDLHQHKTELSHKNTGVLQCAIAPLVLMMRLGRRRYGAHESTEQAGWKHH
jgi:hypothetical protein